MSEPSPVAGVVDTAEAVRAGEQRAEDVVAQHVARAKARADLNALLHLDEERALSAARAVDERRARGEALGALAGVPVVLKDNLCLDGVPTTCASRILEGYRPPYNADCVERLIAEDAVIIAKANMDEFAMGSSNENSAFGPVKNPWDLTRAPGGSSGGSAAATAAGIGAVALGSDTGGSVRQPGAFCGVVAIKPTYGRLSRYGLIAFASSLDQVGTMTRDVRDGARVLRVLAGHDKRDATSAVEPVPDYEAACAAPVSGLRVGVLRAALDQVEDPDVRAAFSAAEQSLRDAGCDIVDIELPHAHHGVSVYYLVATAEASSNLARFDGMRFGLRVTGDDLLSTYERTRAQGFGPEVKRRIMLGTYALSSGYYDAFYIKAQKVRTLMVQDYQRAFERCDAVLSPTAPTPAFGLGEKTGDPLAMYLADIFTLPPSLAGLPAMHVPVGLGQASGLPVGVQVTTPAFTEVRMLQLAAALEARSGYVCAPPALFGGAG
ncbi:MAG: Asp-tRNA(Asn)/Glu-tRNA(Gln) amidotransferase subunit GatA [Myxococcales bacterium]|nr:Asp-tRNA(Asn)/Glu-tRNA(Gln) amidotransferase subunit GatA [Myxococcales bacterium]MCB9626693.1 Asp-tRNA(Asn)/Glu-tRNA(Gln) amidotransferase subunit GatA [Sandaracinaceae bacterium]